MFEGAFSFQGRIGRLNYFLAGLLLLPVVLVALAVGVVAVAVKPTALNVFVFALLVIVAGIGALWYSLSLQVRRIRDIGWSPAIVLVSYVFIQVADKMLAMQVPSLALGTHNEGTAFGLVVALGFALVLLFWPSARSDTDRIAEVFSPVPSRLDAMARDAVPRFETSAPALANGPARIPRKTFGKRGLR